MNQIQQLGAQALRCKHLPFGAKPWALVLTNMGPGVRKDVMSDAVEIFLDKCANWKSPAGKRIKRELRAILERELV